MKKIKTSESGFTLMELMIVIAIVGLLSGLALPNFIASRNDSMLKSAARELLGDIQKTRMGAIRDNEDWEIIFQPGIGYQIRITSTGAAQKTVTFTDRKGGVLYGQGSATAPIGTAFTANFITYTIPNVDILRFNPDGTCEGDGYVYLSNSSGTVFGIGTLRSGVVIFKQWMGAGWSN